MYRKLALFVFVASQLTFCSSIAAAQTQKSDIFVFTNDDDPETKECGVSYSSTIAAANSALRYNRIGISSEFVEKNLNAKISINTMSLTEKMCVFHIRIDFFQFSKVQNPLNGSPALAPNVFCSKSKLLKWEKSTVQIQINEDMRSFTEECIQEIETGANI